jgi:hypothetical protein
MESCIKKVLFALWLLSPALAIAQRDLEPGASELQVWTGGGHSVPGGTSDTSVWNVGLRYGRILTRPLGPSFLKGEFEYAVDVVPAFLIFQPSGRAYGAGFDPLVLKWNFAAHHALVPYLELSGGTLFTNHDVPTGTNTVNFTPSAALGLHGLGERFAWTLELRYLHISNAGLASPNPGLNTLEVRVGIGRFFGHRH